MDFLFNEDPLDDSMNELAFGSIRSNIPCFTLAMVGQFASIGSAAWYLMINYCLLSYTLPCHPDHAQLHPVICIHFRWRILCGYNPLSSSNSLKTDQSIFSLSRFSKKSSKTIRKSKWQRRTAILERPGSPRNIGTLKEDLSLDQYQKLHPQNRPIKLTNEYEEVSSSKSVPPLIDTADILFNATPLTPSPWSSLAVTFSMDDGKDSNDSLFLNEQQCMSIHRMVHFEHFKNIENDRFIMFYVLYRSVREEQETAAILKKHHLVVWTLTIALYVP